EGPRGAEPHGHRELQPRDVHPRPHREHHQRLWPVLADDHGHPGQCRRARRHDPREHLMPGPTLNDLVSPVTYDDALSSELTIAAGLALPTTAWQPTDTIRSAMTTNATIVSQYSTTINLVAQGVY